MMSSDFSQVGVLLKNVGQEIVAWRSDAGFRHLHLKDEFKTEADRCAHNLIAAGLAQISPGVKIISEESFKHECSRPDKYWLIDPIDGTASWYHGFEGFVTQAAYMEYGVPIFAIVHAPLKAKTWTAVRGRGAYLNDIRLSNLQPSERLIFVDNTPTPHGVVVKLMSELRTQAYIESGSLGLKSVLVADGTADLFVKDVCVRDWDLAPAALILHEVGGHLSLLDGSPYIFDGPYEKEAGFVVACDALILAQVVSLLARLKNI
jgi:3'(2'), 5'-bisphosphate nucleotidase